MLSSTSSFEREIPAVPWKQVLLATLLVSALATVGWELYVRSQGYAPTLNDSAYLWADEREKLQDDSLVLIGSSRILFGVDLEILEEELGQKPLQLAMTGASFYPVLQNLLEEESFRGTLLIGVVPAMLPVPQGPPISRPERTIRLWKTRTISERIGHTIALFLEERIAFLKNDDLTLSVLWKKLPIPNRPSAHVPPALPPYFATIERNRRYRMIEACAVPGELQSRIQQTWLPLFSPPPPPSYVPLEAFQKGMMEAMGKHFETVVAAINEAQARGIRVVFLRLPSSGDLRELERKGAPRDRVWDPLLQLTNAPGIHFEDHPELASFTCPEWSHLSGPDSEEFTRRLVPLLKDALTESKSK